MLRIQRSGCATRRVFIKAGNRIRTGDLNLGKVALYQLSYAREASSADDGRRWRHESRVRGPGL